MSETPAPQPAALPPTNPLPPFPAVARTVGNPFLPAGGSLPMQPLVKSFPYADGSSRAE